MKIEFIETPTFTRKVDELLTEDEYIDLQNTLIANPAKGDLIKDGGGIRKIRHASAGRGKSGGVRVIYYWLCDEGQIYMLLVYPKSEKDNLTDKETSVLRYYVKGLKNGTDTI